MDFNEVEIRSNFYQLGEEQFLISKIPKLSLIIWKLAVGQLTAAIAVAAETKNSGLLSKFVSQKKSMASIGASIFLLHSCSTAYPIVVFRYGVHLASLVT